MLEELRNDNLIIPTLPKSYKISLHKKNVVKIITQFL